MFARMMTGCWSVCGRAGVLAVLASCAHDPAPKAPCHGPWVWINAPAQPAAAGISPKQGARPKDEAK